MDIVPRTIVVKTPDGEFTVFGWSNGNIVASDENFFTLLEHRREKTEKTIQSWRGSRARAYRRNMLNGRRTREMARMKRAKGG